MKCAAHPDRTALGYCAQCGKPLCRECLVRLSTGNFCDACANAGDRPLRPRRTLPWWTVALLVIAALILLRGFIH